MGAAFDFLRRERVLAVEKSFSFEFQMKKDGERHRRGELGERGDASWRHSVSRTRRHRSLVSTQIT
jgi:hypothetical protein